MRHRIEAGQDPYVVFVADAPDGRGDLWAMHTGGGESVQLTFSLPAESRPALSPDGDVVAFLRARSAADTLHRRVWLMNLLNGAERELALPEGAGTPEQVAWLGRTRLAVRTSSGPWLLEAPPAEPAPHAARPDEVPAADSAFEVFAGDPPFARIVRCTGGPGLCVAGDSGESALAPEGHDAIAWGADSVGYVEGTELVVRPVGPGHPRRAKLPSRLPNPREFTAFLGRRAGQEPPGP
jgi:hypothetical protein